MTQAGRTAQITAILKTIASEYPADVGASLEAYISELEAKQPDRPDQIAAILKTIGESHSVDMAVPLEAYIADLEARQQAKPFRKSSQDVVKLYWQGVKRDQQHRARALRKQNNHQ